GDGTGLGFNSYSLRNFGWKAMELIEYAASHKLDTIQISSLDDYAALDPAHLQQVKNRAEKYGMKIDGGIGCICPTSASWKPKEGDPGQYVLKGLRGAKAVGATGMRCFMGSGPDRRGKLPIEAHIENTINVLRGIRSPGMDTGVKVAVENHNGDLTAREVRTIIEEAGKDFVGSNL